MSLFFFHGDKQINGAEEEFTNAFSDTWKLDL